MKKIEIVRVESVFYNQPLPMNRAVLNLCFFILSGGEVPPIELQKSDKGFMLKNGRHRLASFKLLGYEFIPARFSEELKKPKVISVKPVIIGLTPAAVAVLFNITINQAIDLINKYDSIK